LRKFSGILLFFLLLAGDILQGASPSLLIKAPPELEGVGRELEAIGMEDFTSSLLMTGLLGFSRPITVVLLKEDHPAARDLPGWVAGYARGDRSIVVLLPARVASYPDRNLRVLLHHEITHLLVWEASGGRGIPRWFNEGLATVAAREWGLEDRARYAAAVIGRGPRNLVQLDRAFSGSGAEVSRAYALSASLIRSLIHENGASTTAEILGRVKVGESFEEAFLHVTGGSLSAFSEEQLQRRRPWTVYLPWLTSTSTLWMLVSLLAVIAILRHRMGKKERLEGLDDEEEIPPFDLN